MKAQSNLQSYAHGQVPDANRWMEHVRAGLEGLMASGCGIGQLEAYIEERLKELGRPLLEEAVQKLADRQALCCPRGRISVFVRLTRHGIGGSSTASGFFQSGA